MNDNDKKVDESSYEEDEESLLKKELEEANSMINSDLMRNALFDLFYEKLNDLNSINQDKKEQPTKPTVKN